MQKKCIIGTHEIMFSQMIACIIRSFTTGFAITETRGLNGLYAELDNDSELFVVIDPRTFSFELEEVCTQIYSVNPKSVIICICPEKCNKFFGLRLYRCGVNSIISNVEDSKNLLAVIRNAFEGATYYPKEIHDAIEMREYITMPDCCSALTMRQMELLFYFAEGKTIKYIAISLGVSPTTISTSITRVVKKLGVATRQEAIKLAIDTGVFGTL